MHKDAIILIQGKSLDATSEMLDISMKEINGKPIIYYWCKYLSQFHFCKVVFSVPPTNTALKKYMLYNRKMFSFAFDFCIEENTHYTGTAIKNAMLYTDSDDVLVFNINIYAPFNIEELVVWQHTKEADVTIALHHSPKKENNTILQKEDFSIESIHTQTKDSMASLGIYSVFRHSFLNINFPTLFSFEEDYLMKYNQERDFLGFKINSPIFDFREQTQLLAFSNYINNILV